MGEIYSVAQKITRKSYRVIFVAITALLLTSFIAAPMAAIAAPDNPSGNSVRIAQAPEDPPDDGGEGGEEGTEDTSVRLCENQGGVFGWIMCPIINGFDSAINALYQFAINRLQFSLFAPITGTGAGVSGLSQESYDNVRKSWQAVTGIPTVLLFRVSMIMIFGTDPCNLIDAYTAKRLLPRIVIAFILINLSWYIVTFAIEIGNIIGGGIRDILLAPFGQRGAVAIITPDLGVAGDLTILGSVIVGIVALFKIPQIGLYLAYLLVPILFSMLIAIAVGLAIIILRQGILILLAVFSPVAFALWVLPGTMRYFDQWRDLLVSMILFYPIFQAVIAIGALLAIVTSSTVDSGGEGGGTGGMIMLFNLINLIH
jgi:hypothetical protein